MLEVGKEKLLQWKMLNLFMVMQWNCRLRQFFDYVTIGFGLRNVPDYLVALKEMNRVLKPGGMVVCLETSQPTLPVFKQMYALYF